jgi:hypothetical protein
MIMTQLHAVSDWLNLKTRLVAKMRLSGFLITVSVLVCVSGTAQTCPMPETGDYVEGQDSDVLTMLAEVIDIDFYSNEVESCSGITYRVWENVAGPQFETVYSQACVEGRADREKVEGFAFDSLEDLSKNRRQAGYYPGALVYVALTRQKKSETLLQPNQSSSEYRLVANSCWDSPHLNIGIWPDERKAEFLSIIHTAAIEEQAKKAKWVLDGPSLLFGIEGEGVQ